MSRFPACWVTLLLAAAPLRAQPAIPSTPAGTALRALLDAYNRGDSASVAAFFRSYQAPGLLRLFDFRRMTGGFELLSIEVSEPSHIEFMTRNRTHPFVGYGALDVTPGTPTRLSSILQPLGINVTSEMLRIDATGRARVIGSMAAQLDSFYVVPELGRRMRDSLQARLARGGYDRYANGAGLSIRLNAELDQLAHDGHLRLIYSLLPRLPEKPTPPTAEEVAQHERTMDEFNCGFRRVEQLEGNVGYVRFDGFDDPARCEATVAAALTFVAGTRALIIDLRENQGGNAPMVGLIASYLFDRRTHMDDLWNRRTDSTLSIWTRDSVPGRRFGGEKPLYILTSAYTVSAAEALAYDLQARKRAVIVGETTGGEAHPTIEVRFDERFGLLLPSGKAINPITGTNWEGVGVKPDVRVTAAEALDSVRKLIRGKSPP